MTFLRAAAFSIVALVIAAPALAGGDDHPQARAPIWQGFHFGAHGGFGTASAGDGLELQGGVGGAHVGYLFQLGRGVFGIEADASATTMEKAGSASYGGFTVDARVGVDMLASIRLVGGFDLGSARVFGTVGAAYTSGSVSASASGWGYSASASEAFTASGPVFGGGVEFRTSPRIALRAEVLHYAFSEITMAGTTAKADLSATVGRFGVTMRAQ